MGRLTYRILAGIGAVTVLSFIKTQGIADFGLLGNTAKVVTEKATEAVNSEEGQQAIADIKDTAYGLTTFAIREASEKLDDVKSAVNDLHEAALVRVVDGDTINVVIDGEEKTVRLIGIDTPESVNPDESKNNEFGEAASNYTKALLSGVDTVYLQYDVEIEDKYGRTLAYVWIKDNVDIGNKQDIANYMLNGILVNNGYAMDKMYVPNIRYNDVFEELRENADESKTGLWQSEGFRELWENA